MPVIPTNLSQAIEKTLDETGIPELSAPKELIGLLKAKGVDMDTLATELTNLLLNSKSATKHKIVMDLLALHGVDFRTPENKGVTIAVNFVAKDDSPINVQVNNMFAPER